MNRLIAALLSVLLGTALTACADVGSSSDPVPGQSGGLSLSWAEAYPSVAEMSRHADAIVLGRVVAVSGTASEANIPYTNFKYSVDTWIAGRPDSGVIYIHQAGDKSTAVEDDPLLRVDESNLLFLRKYAAGKYSIMGGPTGRLISTNGTLSALPTGRARDGLPAPSEAFVARIGTLRTAVAHSQVTAR